MPERKRISKASTSTRKRKNVSDAKFEKNVSEFRRIVSSTGKLNIKSDKSLGNTFPSIKAHRLPDIGSTVEMPIYKPLNKPANQPENSGSKNKKQ